MIDLQEKVDEINERVKQMDEDLVSLIISKLEELEQSISRIEDKIK